MKKKGLTLIELMIALTIFSTFSVFMYRFFGDEQKSIIAKHRQLDMHYSALLVMDNIESILRNNPTLYYYPSNKLVYKDSSRSVVLINVIAGDSTAAELKFDSFSNSLKDRDGNTISRGIESITISPDPIDSNLMIVEVKMFYGSGARELRYNIKNTINIKK
jgi:prepilin-type N-terminal cleavage/methylation domain-containing protein